MREQIGLTKVCHVTASYVASLNDTFACWWIFLFFFIFIFFSVINPASESTFVGQPIEKTWLSPTVGYIFQLIGELRGGAEG